MNGTGSSVVEIVFIVESLESPLDCIVKHQVTCLSVLLGVLLVCGHPIEFES